MNTTPRHIQIFRLVLVTAVLLVLVVVGFLISWDDLITALDPAVDGLRRRVWS